MYTKPLISREVRGFVVSGVWIFQSWLPLAQAHSKDASENDVGQVLSVWEVMLES
jgi:hypothetical protein